jgi:hypothetical protein
MDPQASQEYARQFGWSLERIAVTSEDLPPVQRYAVNPLRERATTSSTEHVLQPKALEPSVRKENTTGLPDQLKAGIEHLSGLSLDHVHVHYNSPQPADVQALAYTQGTQIHVGPGQEQHLAHEAWHVVQQMQGRVSPTMQAKGVAINDNQALEQEADVMGQRVQSMPSSRFQEGDTPAHAGQPGSPLVVQRRVGFEFEAVSGETWNVQGTTDGVSYKLVTETKKPLLQHTAKTDLTADNGHIEFVTEPLASYTEVKAAMNAIVSMAGAFSQSPQMRTFAVGNTFAGGTWVAEGGYIGYRTKAAGTMKGKAQATVGVTLDHLANLLTGIGSAANTGNKRDPLSSPIYQGYTSGSAARAALIVQSIPPPPPPTPALTVQEQDALIGFLSIVLMYLDYGQNNLNPGQEDPKYLFALMARTDFHAMYEALPGAAKIYALTELMPPTGFLAQSIDALFSLTDNFFAGSYKAKDETTGGGETTETGPTRTAWLASIISGNRASSAGVIAKDLLSPPPGLRPHDAPNFNAEGMGAMETDDQTAVHQGYKILFELREIFEGNSIPVEHVPVIGNAISNLIYVAEGDGAFLVPGTEPKILPAPKRKY